MRTNLDRNAKLARPLAEALFPAEFYQERTARRRAIDRDGNLNPAAIPVNVTHIPRLKDETGTAASTSSTTDWEDAIWVDDLFLPSYGTWRIDIDVGGTLSNSGGGDVDVQLLLNGEVLRAVTPTCAAISSGGTYCRLAAMVTGVASGTAIDVRLQIKSDASGTSTARRLVLRVDAYRT